MLLCIIVDEVSLKHGQTYDKSTDDVNGLQDGSSEHTQKYANQELVLMAQSVQARKQPLAIQHLNY